MLLERCFYLLPLQCKTGAPSNGRYFTHRLTQLYFLAQEPHHMALNFHLLVKTLRLQLSYLISRIHCQMVPLDHFDPRLDGCGMVSGHMLEGEG